MKQSNKQWFGALPEQWEISTIGALYTVRNEKVSDTEYPPLSVTMKGVVPQLETAAKTDAHDDRKLIKKGDFAINSRSDRRGSCGISEYDGSVSLINTILTPRAQMNPHYYNWLFHTAEFADEFYKWGHGIVDDLWTTRWQEMKNISLPIPSLAEQEKISGLLAEKVSKIDALILNQERQIEKLKQYKQSLITEVVTKGLDPTVPLKDSGVELLGFIPQIWNCLSVARVATVVRGASPRPAGDVRFFGGDYLPWITVGEVTKDDSKYITKTDSFLTKAGVEQSRIVDPNTLILSNSGATLGIPKITKIRGCINDGSVAFLDLKINQSYLLYVLSAYTNELRKQRQGYGQPNLNTDLVKSIKIPVPSIDEQEKISEYLDRLCVNISKMISLKKIKIEKLNQYKKSLIYEYVTGKRR